MADSSRRNDLIQWDRFIKVSYGLGNHPYTFPSHLQANLRGYLKSNLLIFNDKKQIFWWYNKCEHFYFGFQYDS